MKQLFLYCLAVLAKRHGILVHAAVLMSTHEHLVVTDESGHLPDFLREFHRMLALGVKRLRGWQGPVWDHRKTSVVELSTPQSIVEKLAYTIANPATAGLVRRSEEWPGVTTNPNEMGHGVLNANKPALLVGRDSSRWPPNVSLKISLPPCLASKREALIEAVRSELAALESAAEDEARNKGWRFPTRKRLRAQSPFRRAASAEPENQLVPAIAVGRRHRADLALVRSALTGFRCDYRRALSQWREGARDVVFPAGTWLMRRLHGAVVDVAAAVTRLLSSSLAAE